MAQKHVVQRLDEQQAMTGAAWDEAKPLYIRHYLWEDNGYQPEVEVRLFYTDENLHVRFRTHEDNPTITYYRMNEEVYKDSCVEFFVQPLPSQDDRYLNFEMNAAGTLLLGLGAGRNRSRLALDPGIFNIDAKTGLKDQNGKTYWQVQYSVPFSFIKNHFPAFEAQAGAELRANFYKCGEDVPQPHYGCWNLIESDKPDFHVSEFFGHLVLG